MSEIQPTKNAPIERLSDGAVSAKIWRNTSKEGKPFYNVTFARVYTDPQTGKPAETQSFSGTDVLKIQRLAAQSYHVIDRHRKLDRDQNPDAAQDRSLAQNRDAVMKQAASSQARGDAQMSPQQSGPELEQ